MSKKILILAALLCFVTSIFAQTEEEMKKRDGIKKAGEGLPDGWTTGGSFGLNLDQLLVIQPRNGAGDNKLGFGGNGTLFGTYKSGRFVWDNNFSLKEVFQRLGKGQSSGLLNPLGGNPFQKTLDLLEFYSKPSYAITADEKWFAAIEAGLQSQLLKTYAGNYLKAGITSIDDSTNTVSYGDPISQIFSPATVMIAPGVEYKPNENFNVLFSPASSRIVIVANDVIADDPSFDEDGAFLGSRHGNPLTYNAATGLVTDFKNIDYQLGASIKAKYQNNFLNDRVSFATTAYAFYNYLGGAGDKNLPVFEWTTNTGFNIIKGISINLLTGLYYDYNKPVQKGWKSEATPTSPAGYQSQGRGAMFTEQILITYSKILGAERKE